MGITSALSVNRSLLAAVREMVNLKEIYIHKSYSYSPEKETINRYIQLLNDYVKDNNCRPTECHIDTLINMYKASSDDRVFNRLLGLYKDLLKKMAVQVNKDNILERDDLICNLNFEFYRRVLYYDPSIAPFSKVLKLYIKQWIYAYWYRECEKKNRIDEKLSLEICM